MTSAKDILLIFIGQAGINIAERYWRYAYETLGIPLPPLASNEGDIDKQLNATLEMTEFYSEFEIEEARRMFFYNLTDEHEREDRVEVKRYIPRSLFIDVEDEPIKGFMHEYRRMFPKEAYIYNTHGSFSMYARAKRLGIQLKPYLLERILNMIKSRSIENLEGIAIVHATGGGAGSGLLDMVFEVLEDRFSKVPILTFTVFPSAKLSSNVVEAYNSVYASNVLLNHANASILLDNDKILDLIRQKYGIESPTFEDLNLIISRLIFSTLMQFAMPGATMRVDFNKIFTNLVPYKYMKFLTTGIAPFKFDEFSRNTSEELVDELTDAGNFLVDVDFSAGKFTATLFMFIGKIGPEVKTLLRTAKERLAYMPWIPTGIFTAITPREKMTLDGMPLLRQGIIIANHSSIRTPFQRILTQFKLMYDREAFLVHYLREDIDSKQDLQKAAANVLKMIKFYQIAEKSTAQKTTVKEIL